MRARAVTTEISSTSGLIGAGRGRRSAAVEDRGGAEAGNGSSRGRGCGGVLMMTTKKAGAAAGCSETRSSKFQPRYQTNKGTKTSASVKYYKRKRKTVADRKKGCQRERER